MKIKRDLVLEIVESESYQEAIAGPMVDEYVRKLTLPGADGKTSRNFLMDWLYLQRPMFDRFRGARFNVQFEGPAVVIDREEFPIGCMIEREIEWVRIAPDEAAVLLCRLRAAVDEVVTDWIGGRPMKFLPARPQRPFPDRAAADAEAAQIIRDFPRSNRRRTAVPFARVDWCGFPKSSIEQACPARPSIGAWNSGNFPSHIR